jgi:hypothetical protein
MFLLINVLTMVIHFSKFKKLYVWEVKKILERKVSVFFLSTSAEREHNFATERERKIPGTIIIFLGKISERVQVCLKLRF